MLVVAVVAIIVVGPKDLPKMLRTFGKAMGNMRRMAGDFQKQFDDAVREAELDEVKNIASGKGFAPLDDVKKAAEKYNRDFKQSIADAGKGVNDALDDKKATGMASAGEDAGAVAKESLPEPAAAPAKAASGTKTAAKTVAKTTAGAKTVTGAKTPKPAPAKPAAQKPASAKPAPKKPAPKKRAKTS